MDILAALFVDEIQARQVAGPSTRIDLTGVQFSAAAPAPFPLVWAPHLVVLVHCPFDAKPDAALEVTYHRTTEDGDDEEIARNVQPLNVEPGKFNYRLVRAELEFDAPGRVEARCRLDMGPIVTVPYTMLPPVNPAPPQA